MTEKDNEKEVEDTFKDLLRGLEKSKLPIEKDEKQEDENLSKEDKEV